MQSKRCFCSRICNIMNNILIILFKISIIEVYLLNYYILKATSPLNVNEAIIDKQSSSIKYYGTLRR